MFLLSSRNCVWKCSFSPLGAANGPWNEVTPVLLSCLCPCDIRYAGPAPGVSQPRPDTSAAEDFPRIRFQPVSGTPGAAWEKGEREDWSLLIKERFFINLGKKPVSLSIYLSFSVSFFAQGAVSIWLLVRNSPFSTISENGCLCWSGFHFVWSRAVWFLSQGRRKRKKIQFRRSGADLCAWVFFFSFF